MNSFYARLAPVAVLLSIATGAIGCSSTVAFDELAAGEDSSGSLSQPSDQANEEAKFGEFSSSWSDDDRSIEIVTYGSSSCIPVITAISVPGVQQIDIRLEHPTQDRFCTMDYAPQVNEFRAPSQISPNSTVHLTVTLPDGETVKDFDLSAK